MPAPPDPDPAPVEVANNAKINAYEEKIKSLENQLEKQTEEQATAMS